MTDRYTSQQALEFYARTYDLSIPDWPGEIDFYRQQAAQARARGRPVLEIACGTGRVALPLARDGSLVIGLDISAPMIQVIQSKSAGMENVRWVEADMRSFDLGETFGLIYIAAHSFQNLTTPAGQVACLESIKRHLDPDGELIIHLDHQSLDWLGRLPPEGEGVFGAAGEFIHPDTGRTIRPAYAWSLAPATQTAILETKWEEIGPAGEVTGRWETGPIRLHVLFRFEMEHLLARTGFAVQAVYGDFSGSELGDNSSEMIWVAHHQ